MHYEVHDSSGTPLLLLHGGLFDIHQQFGELLPGKLRTTRPANHRGGRLKLAHPQVLTISLTAERLSAVYHLTKTLVRLREWLYTSQIWWNMPST